MPEIDKTRLVLLIILLVFVFIEFSWVQAPRPSPDYRPQQTSFVDGTCPATPYPGEEFGRTDYNWDLRSLSGEDISLAGFRDKVVFINVWATWCGPCQEELPSIQGLYEALKDDNVAILVISEEKEAPVRAFIEENGYTFPVYRSAQMPAAFESDGIPATFVVDRNGKIVLRRVGAAEWNTDACHSFLRSFM